MVSHRDFIILLLKSGVKPFSAVRKPTRPGARPGACRAAPWNSRILKGGGDATRRRLRPPPAPDPPALRRSTSTPEATEPTGTHRYPLEAPPLPPSLRAIHHPLPPTYLPALASSPLLPPTPGASLPITLFLPSAIKRSYIAAKHARVVAAIALLRATREGQGVVCPRHTPNV